MSIKTTYQPTSFGGHSHSDNKNIISLVCHVISQDQVMKKFYDFMVSIVYRGYKHCGSKDVMVVG